ncbi:acyl carrier protein [Paenibacillus tepidiphilus]|uniref:acyl carrier protein n=1 Tax=Paenibacillus tepidiphilus TaxID=2608683 RepID=UPI00123BA933|nr:acyl carrier protein [Paenibacillus tepidiphilus]
MSNTLLAEITAYIVKLTGEEGLEPSDHLFESGLLTSLDVLDMISHLENTYGVELTDEDVDIQQFGTIAGLYELVNQKSGERQRNVGV